jgi:hypothetical protein
MSLARMILTHSPELVLWTTTEMLLNEYGLRAPIWLKHISSCGHDGQSHGLIRQIIFGMILEQLVTWCIERAPSCALSNPYGSLTNTLLELQRLSPDAFNLYISIRVSQEMRKIRANLLETVEDGWRDEVIRWPFPSLVLARCSISASRLLSIEQSQARIR